MSLRIIIALIFVSVNGRPQSPGLLQPIIFQQYFVPINPGEPQAFGRIYPLADRVYLKTEPRSLRQETRSEMLRANLPKAAQHNRPQKDNPLNENDTNHPIKPEKDKIETLVKTKKEDQEIIPTTISVFTNEYKTESNQQAVKTKETDRTGQTHMSDVNPDANRNTVVENESVSNGRSDNSSTNSGPGYMNDSPQILRPPSGSKPEERNDDGMKYADEDRWVWGYEDVSTPVVDDRSNFDGSACPNDQVKVGEKCVPKD